jgi:hypothetical protein
VAQVQSRKSYQSRFLRRRVSLHKQLDFAGRFWEKLAVLNPFNRKAEIQTVRPPEFEFADDELTGTRKPRRNLVLPVLMGAILFFAMTGALRADVNSLPAGYSIKLISSNVTADQISQLAFNPGDMTHVYAARDTLAKVARYDYDPVTGMLSHELMVATNTNHKELIGIGFHRTNLYVTFDYTDSTRPGDGRIARFMYPNSNGVYQVRHDFVYGINKGDHDANMIKIKGDSLYVGIGGAGRNGNPAIENIYTLTIARIVDLNQIVTVTNQIGAAFKGPINYLASATEWTNTAGADGQLRYFASGFRNPFGINFDPEGDLWVSVNGNSDVGYFSDDLLYKKVPLGGEGDFPPPSFGFAKYITGTPIAPFISFGVSPSPTGFDFITSGPDAGKILLTEAGATKTATLGRDLLLIDSNTGSHQQIYQFSTNSTMTDVLRDPYGRFLISDYRKGNIWLLTPPLPAPNLDAVVTNGSLRLAWPLAGVEHKLEETSDLGSTNSWHTSSAAIQINPGAIEAQVPLTNTARFLRLRKQSSGGD